MEPIPIPRVASTLNRLRAPPGTQMDNGIVIVDRLLEPQTIAHFLQSCVNQELPTGIQYKSLTPTVEEMMLMTSPYSEWAPPPYDKLLDSAMDQIMIRIGSYEDSTRLVNVQQPLHYMKTRLWEGLLPVSEQRWRLLELDNPKHHRMACEHLGSVIAVFEYLEQHRGKLRTTFNLISDHLEQFDTVLNALRTSRGQSTLSTAMLWSEYMTAHFHIMTTRAHAWVHRHAYKFLHKLLEELRTDRMDSDQSVSNKQWDLTNRFHDLMEIASRADNTILIPMVGYSRCNETVTAPLYNSDWRIRQQAHFRRIKELTQANMVATLFGTTGTFAPDGGIAAPTGISNRCKEQMAACDDARIEVRGELQPTPKEKWIQQFLKSRALANDREPPVPAICGFVIYRITYSATQEKWSAFQDQLLGNLAQCDDEMSGMREIKDMLHFHWLDGSQLAIGEGDIEAAKSHFRTFREEAGFPASCSKEVFLAVDDDSIASYIAQSIAGVSSLFSGSIGGFVLAVDAEFDPDEEDDERAEESPGYSGVLRILGDLVWTDLFALMQTQAVWPRQLWPAAMEQPDSIYIGPITQWMRDIWVQDGPILSESDVIKLQSQAYRAMFPPEA